MNVEALIAKRLAAKKSFKTVLTFADGSTHDHLTETVGQANTFALAKGNALGKLQTNPTTGAVSKLVSIAVGVL